MISPAEIAAARAIPMPWLVGRDLPLQKQGALYVANCPFHSEKTPSFTVYLDHAWCFGCMVRGVDKPLDPIAWLRRTRRLDFESAVRELCGGYLVSSMGVASVPKTRRRAPRATEVPSLALYLWRTADAPQIAELYLDSRGLRVRPKPLPEALRGHQAVWCTETREHRPATLAAVTDDAGALLAVQRIYCSARHETVNGESHPKGTLATDLKKPKKHLGSPRDGAVRLCDPKETLGLTEGVEDAIAVRQIYSLPCWAMVGGGRLGALAVPKITRHIVIFGDADAAGRALAEKAAREYDERPGLSASIVYPQGGAKDFCEELNG